jgi:hypothetical protein
MDQKFPRPVYPNQMVYKAYYYPYEDKPYYVSTYYSEDAKSEPKKRVKVREHHNYFSSDLKYIVLIIIIIFLLQL